MKELLVISGKGGTGKTSLTAAFAALASDKVLLDLDVDAPDMHLLLRPDVKQRHPFVSGHMALVRPDDCSACGTCVELCAFGAIEQLDGVPAVVDPTACEGCKLCVELCPEGAIDFPSRHCGDWFVSDTRFGPLVHAQLLPGEENSGRLVSLLREQAKEIASAQGLDLILADGTPGIGCPVISSLSGVSLALVVTEPTPSGRHDLERVLELCGHFRVPAAVLINKADLNPALADEIDALCQRLGVTCLGRLCFDPVFVEAVVAAKVISEQEPQGETTRQVASLWRRVEKELSLV